ncbi:GL21836 [Drosophila persimilis]|uniref:GL21836 n=1 Tax=Drosophila persimilis TaxID=7234 RepID=B4GED8_DROPE|nr:GL21836 [Drosophila persimilis]
MAIDFLILALLLVSFLINLLALCAFWITPGLRTTANRFTINLLAINLIGCCILAPTLFLGGVRSLNEPQSGPAAESIEFYSKPGNHQVTIRRHGQVVEQDGIVVRRNISDGDTIETIFKCNATYCRELTIDERGDGGIVITETETHEDNLSAFGSTPSPLPTPAFVLPPVEMRCWSIDMTAALGALAVLLVVGDTWCAVTDPLRYHSRISGVKTWVFIALTWAVGILFGALSALRVLDFEADTLLSRQRRLAATFFNISSTNSIFGVVYACVYFIVIILLPFGFVCGMYWRIFSEARGNGLRMRQNGSSPLLQSALNLTGAHQAAQANQYANSLCVHRHSISSASSHGGCSGGGGSSSVGGLQMQIDQRQQRSSPSCLRRDSAAKVLLPTISDDGGSDGDAESNVGIQLMPVPEQTLADRNQNILLTLQTASGEIKRNYSARQLPLLGTSSQDLRETNRLQGIRQVHSSPNLHKYTELRQDSLSDECGSPHLLGHAQLQQQQTIQQHHQQQQQQSHQHQQQHHPHFSSPRHQHLQHQHQLHGSLGGPSGHALQIPAIHASPKALSYMSSLRHRLSNASSLFKYREESRAARISILVVIMFVVSYLPFGLLVLLQARLSAANFGGSSQLAIFMILLANLSSPFIFAYRNKRESSSSLQRHCSSSIKTNGTGGAGGIVSGPNAAQLQRNSSKLSQYSSNSCRYLTPQSSLVSQCQPAAVHTTLTLRPNSSCSTIINFGTTTRGSAESEDLPSPPLAPLAPPAPPPPPSQTRNMRPKLQRGITIVEHISLSPPTPRKYQARRGRLFEMFFRGSKKLQSNCGMPTEV